jgi:hypothetical protein
MSERKRDKRVFIEWRNAVGGQLDSAYADEGADAGNTIVGMIGPAGYVHAGDSFHIMEATEE